MEGLARSRQLSRINKTAQYPELSTRNDLVDILCGASSTNKKNSA